MSISDRLRQLMATVPQHRRFKTLEALTGVASDRWSAFSLGRQRPNAEMLEGIGRAFPKLSSWLLTGQAHGDQIGLSDQVAYQIRLDLELLDVSRDPEVVARVQKAIKEALIPKQDD